MTIGKRIGLFSFILSEILIFTISVLEYVSGNFRAEVINMIIMAQITVFTVSWRAKASSNFAKKNQDGGAG